MKKLADYIAVYDDFFPDDICDRMVAAFEALPQYHEQNGVGVRAGLELSSWVEMNVSRCSAPQFMDFMYEACVKACQRYYADIDLPIAIPMPERYAEFVTKRYRRNGKDGFQPHYDSMRAVADRYLVLLWYLNDVDVGGETTFVNLNLKVPARKGRMLIFPPYWMYQHAGERPVSSDKYIMSTYLLWGKK